jgi:hypothetical protein
MKTAIECSKLLFESLSVHSQEYHKNKSVEAADFGTEIQNQDIILEARMLTTLLGRSIYHS